MHFKVGVREEMRTVGTTLQTIQAEVSEQLPKIQQVECLLDFAEWILDRIAGLWNVAPLHTKLRIQRALFPDGITVTPQGFGTTPTPVFCNSLDPIPLEETTLASQGVADFERLIIWGSGFKSNLIGRLAQGV